LEWAEPILQWADDASVIYYNPAGLALVDGISITSLYTNQYGAAGYLALGGAVNHIGAES